jgi:phytol kinase
VFGAAALLHGAILAARRVWTLPGELTRKLVHMTTGSLALSFPFLFRAAWPVAALAGGACLIVLWTRHTAPGRRFERWYGLGSSRRLESLGEFYFAAAIGLLFLLVRTDFVRYAVPLAAITYGDAAAAIVGKRWGRRTYRTPAGETKSLEGSAAFLAVSCLTGAAVFVAAGAPVAGVAVPLVAVSLVMTVLEAVSVRGVDNLLVPAGGLLALRLLGF